MRVRVLAVSKVGNAFKVGEVLEVYNQAGFTYVLDKEGDKLYFSLETGKCSWFDSDLDANYYTFEALPERELTKPEAFRIVADNIEQGKEALEGLEAQLDSSKWKPVTGLLEIQWYKVRLKEEPKFITLTNGIEIPKPLTKEELSRLQGTTVYLPHCRAKGYDYCFGSTLFSEWAECSLFYPNQEEAQKASVALFGLDLDV